MESTQVPYSLTHGPHLGKPPIWVSPFKPRGAQMGPIGLSPIPNWALHGLCYTGNIWGPYGAHAYFTLSYCIEHKLGKSIFIIYGAHLASGSMSIVANMDGLWAGLSCGVGLEIDDSLYIMEKVAEMKV